MSDIATVTKDGGCFAKGQFTTLSTLLSHCTGMPFKKIIILCVIQTVYHLNWCITPSLIYDNTSIRFESIDSLLYITFY